MPAAAGDRPTGGDGPASGDARAGPAAPAEEPARRPSSPQADERPSRDDSGSHAVPTVLRASGGGATIVSFDWIDRDDDYVGMSGRTIAPGGGKDEHFRLVIDLPAAATVEEIAITGGGVLHWTTRPTPRLWPVGVVANQELKNRYQRLVLGHFSGRYTFDLYVESHPTVRPGQAFGVEVVLSIARVQHRLTARCHRR